jgi:hypothetical protein
MPRLPKRTITSNVADSKEGFKEWLQETYPTLSLVMLTLLMRAFDTGVAAAEAARHNLEMAELADKLMGRAE